MNYILQRRYFCPHDSGPTPICPTWHLFKITFVQNYICPKLHLSDTTFFPYTRHLSSTTFVLYSRHLSATTVKLTFVVHDFCPIHNICRSDRYAYPNRSAWPLSLFKPQCSVPLVNPNCSTLDPLAHPCRSAGPSSPSLQHRSNL